MIILNKVYNKLDYYLDKIFEIYLKLIFGVQIGKNCRISRKCSIRCIYKSIKIGDNCIVEPYVRIKAIQNHNRRDKVININSNVFIGYATVIDSGNYIEIGNYTMIGPQVFITDVDHRLELKDVPIASQGSLFGETIIKENVWIGSQVQILRGSVIQKNSVVGANSTVLSQMEEESLIVGIPAKVKKTIVLK